MSLAQRMHFLQNMPQMIAIAMVAYLNSLSKLINHPDALFLWYGMNLLIYDHFEFSSRFWIVFIHVILQESLEIKIWGFKSSEYKEH